MAFKKCFLTVSEKWEKPKTYPTARLLDLSNTILLCRKIIPKQELGYWIKYLHRSRTTEFSIQYKNMVNFQLSFLLLFVLSKCQNRVKVHNLNYKQKKKVLKLNALSKTTRFHFCVPHQESHFLALVSNPVLKHLSNYKHH